MDDLIVQMKNPDFYPHECGEIKIVQTHISWVILTGNYAYKIKKPVKFSFLDFSTPEKRKFYVEEEFRLNRRFGGDIYLEILPVYKSGSSFSLQPGGDIFEYILKMREFPQKNLLGNIYENGLLDGDMLEELGRTVARYHKEALPAPEKFCSADSVIRTGLENLDEAAQFVGKTISKECLDVISRETRLFQEKFRRLLEARGQYFRECHGDLHLNNICLFSGKLAPFDCIEFNENFRMIDTVYDVAFLFMDLMFRDERLLAYRFINSWLSWTGDFEAASLLNFYASYRAMIRGKVYSYMTLDEEIMDRKGIAAKAEKFFILAEKLLGRPPGKIVIMSGLSGSGKSTVARYLAGQGGYIHIRSDVVRKHLAGLDLMERGGRELYSPEMSARTYREMEEAGIAAALSGQDVILDARYNKKMFRDAVRKMCSDNGIRFAMIYCYAQREELTRRLDKREGDVSDATSEILAFQLDSDEPPIAEESDDCLKIDTSLDWQNEIDRIGI